MNRPRKRGNSIQGRGHRLNHYLGLSVPCGGIGGGRDARRRSGGFSTDPGAPFTSQAFTDVLKTRPPAIRMDVAVVGSTTCSSTDCGAAYRTRSSICELTGRRGRSGRGWLLRFLHRPAPSRCPGPRHPGRGVLRCETASGSMRPSEVLTCPPAQYPRPTSGPAPSWDNGRRAERERMAPRASAGEGLTDVRGILDTRSWPERFLFERETGRVLPLDGGLSDGQAARTVAPIETREPRTTGALSAHPALQAVQPPCRSKAPGKAACYAVFRGAKARKRRSAL